MNSYNISEIGHEDTILYHAVASEEQEVRELAEAKEIDLTNMVIELERSDVKNELGRSYNAHIEDAQVH